MTTIKPLSKTIHGAFGTASFGELPPSDAEQRHILDEIEHEVDYLAFHDLAYVTKCGEQCCQLFGGGAPSSPLTPLD